MQKARITISEIVAFALEICALVFWGLWAWGQPQALMPRWLLALAVVGGFITLWALFCAPKGRLRIPMPWLLVAKLPMLLLPGLLYLRQNVLLMTLWIVLVMGHVALSAAQWEK